MTDDEFSNELNREFDEGLRRAGVRPPRQRSGLTRAERRKRAMLERPALLTKHTPLRVSERRTKTEKFLAGQQALFA